MRYIDADVLHKAYMELRNFKQDPQSGDWISLRAVPLTTVIRMLNEAPSIDIVFCRECKHRPIKEDANEEDYGFNVIAPNEDERCPCLVEDGWYSWIPKDDFYCGYGEREGE